MYPTSPQSRPRLGTTILAAALAASLAACDRDDPRTAGQKVDDTIAKVEKQAEEIRADAREAARDAKQAGNEMARRAEEKVADARQATSNAADAAANKVKDAVITSRVRAQLAGDPSLNPLMVTVETQAGRVSLRGQAPDTAAAERAASLAGAVDGVVSVDNQLAVTNRP